MKTMKKMLALLAAMVMVLALCVPAYADEATYSITINNSKTGHTYEAYQILTGTLTSETDDEGNTTKFLTDAKWGQNAAANYTQGNAVTDSEMSTLETAEDLSTYVNFGSTPIKTVSTQTDSTYVISGLSTGYYLIKDKDDSLANIKGDSYTKYIVKVLGDNVTVSPKTDSPSVEKKVYENTEYNDPDSGYVAGYNDVADYNIGDPVPFQLISPVPDMTYYSKYKYVFHDTLSTGLTAPNESSVKVYVADSKDSTGNARTEITSSFTTTVSGQSITVSCNDIKSIDGVSQGRYIIVEYTATLNSNAVIGLSGNPNTVYLEYSNNPNGDGTGKTPEDKVIVFTYELDTTKVDGSNTAKKLSGAEFKLYRYQSDGTTKEYVQVNTTDSKVTGWTTETEGSTLTSKDDGLFKVIGLDDGIYYLKETKAPTGYNTLTSDIQLTISATTTNGQSWSGTASDALTALKIKVNDGDETDGNTSTGIVETTVQNNKGSSLPETGGIGTTIFFVVGGILAAGAAILLITRRRIQGEME